MSRWVVADGGRFFEFGERGLCVWTGDMSIKPETLGVDRYRRLAEDFSFKINDGDGVVWSRRGWGVIPSNYLGFLQKHPSPK